MYILGMFTNLGTPSLYGIGLAYIKEHTDRDKQPMYSLCFKQIFPSGQIRILHISAVAAEDAAKSYNVPFKGGHTQYIDAS